MTAALNAMRVLTDPVDTGAVTLALPQDVQAEAYDYPKEFFKKRVHYIERRIASEESFNRAAELINRKSTRLNSSHVAISYAVFCLKKKKKHERHIKQRHTLALTQ